MTYRLVVQCPQRGNHVKAVPLETIAVETVQVEAIPVEVPFVTRSIEFDLPLSSVGLLPP